MEINTLVLKGKENVNDYVTVPSVVRSVDRYRWRFGGCGLAPVRRSSGDHFVIPRYIYNRPISVKVTSSMNNDLN